MTRLLILFFGFFFYALPVIAQEESNYHIQQYTTENGMPSNGIRGLQWDEKTNFLWLATEAGVVRFNGIDFTTFTKEDMPGLSQERMAYVAKNNLGKIFAADVEGNILQIASNTPRIVKYPFLSGLSANRKKFILSVTDSNTRKKILAQINQSGNVLWNKLLQLNDTSIAILDQRSVLYRSSPLMTGFIEEHTPQKFINGFTINKNSFVLDTKGVFYIASDNFTIFKPVATGFSIAGLNNDKNLLLWENGMDKPLFFSGKNAWILDYKNNILEAELICSMVPPYSFIRFAQYSKEKQLLFIGTDSKGIIIIHKNKLLPVKKKNPDIWERNAYYAQVELPGNDILTNEGHIIGPSLPYNGSLPINDKFSYTVHPSGDSVLWFAQVNQAIHISCLKRYNYKTRTTKIFDQIPVRESFAIAFSGGKTYVATDIGMGFLENDSLHFLFKNHVDKRIYTAPYTMEEIEPGIFVTATCNGLIRYNVKTLTTDTLLQFPGYCVRSLLKYNDYLFIGTYGKGYYLYKNGVLKKMPLDKNNFLLYTHCFVPDDYGYCWISTNRGLFKANVSDIITAFEKNIPQIYYHYFGKNDGMETTEMNGGCAPCALVMKNNTISFPTMDGLLWVNTQTVLPGLPAGNIYLDEFTYNNKKINTDSLALSTLPPNTKDIQVQIGFSAWCNKENIYLDYQLNNAKTWTPVNINNGAFIKLSGLSPGKYKLLIRKMNGFGIDNYSYKEINFTISTPWHQQWWFYLLCVAGIFGLLTLYFRFRTRQYKIKQRTLENQVAEKTKELQAQNEMLEKNNSIKTRLISIISHDIVTPLKFLTVAGKNLLERRKIMPEELQQETIQEITTTSQELQLLSTNILNWIKYQNENRRLVKETFNLHEMVQQVFGILQSLAKQKKLTIENLVDTDLKVQQYYEPLKILIYNLLTNAIHFTEKGIISVASSITKEDITIIVKDQGIGMTPEQIKRILADEVVITSANIDNKKGHGLGYLIIKDLLKTMGASLYIESIKGEGCSVSIKIPVSNRSA